MRTLCRHHRPRRTRVITLHVTAHQLATIVKHALGQHNP